MAENTLYPLRQMQVRLKVTEGEPLYGREPMDSPLKAADVIRDMLAGQDREFVCMCNLDNRCRPLNFHIVSIGSISQCEVPIANIFKAAILSNASSIMLFHNHPSGDPAPSEADRRLTESLVKAGRLMNIPVNDHIIIGGGTGLYFSFFEHEQELFRSSQFDQHLIAEGQKEKSQTDVKKASVIHDLKQYKDHRPEPVKSNHGVRRTGNSR